MRIMDFDENDKHVKLWREDRYIYLVIYPNGNLSALYYINVSMGFTWTSWITKKEVQIVEIDPGERICWVDHVV